MSHKLRKYQYIQNMEHEKDFIGMVMPLNDESANELWHYYGRGEEGEKYRTILEQKIKKDPYLSKLQEKIEKGSKKIRGDHTQ